MKKLFFTLALSLPLLFSACGNNDDDEPDFDIPKLTDNNTIRFTVDMDSKLNLNIEAILGERTAVDWGDGTVNKYYISNPSKLVGHKYKNSGRYHVRVWADEVTLFNLASLFYNTIDFNMGNCPKLETLAINSIKGMTHFEVGDNCPKLTNLNIGSCPNLASMDVSKCVNIEFIQCYNNQALKSLDISKNDKLRHLDCPGNQLETLIGNSNLNQLDCNGNKLSYLNFGDMKELTELSISDNGISSIDISGLSKLSTLIISDNNISEIDLSTLSNLSRLTCSKNDLSILDVSSNSLLRSLECSENKLTSIAVSLDKSKSLMAVDITYNELSKEKLYEIFNALPQSPYPRTSVSLPACIICFNNNPGVNEAGFSDEVLKNKGWKITTNQKSEN